MVGETPLERAIEFKETKIADLLRKHGGKTGEKLKAEEKWNAESSLPNQAKF